MNDGYMDAAAVPVPDAGDTMDGEFDLAAVKVLIDHQRRDAGSCICGWGLDAGNPGQSHALHVWRELQAVGVTLPVPDAGDDTLRERLAQALTPLCDLPRVQHTYGNRGPCLHDRARADALLPLIREHVAAAVQGERDKHNEESAIERVRKIAFDPEIVSGLEHGVIGTSPDTYGGIGKDEAIDIGVYALRDIRAALDGSDTP